MKKTVYLHIRVELEGTPEDLANVENIVNELDYNITSTVDGVMVTDTNMVEMFEDPSELV